MSSLKAYQHTLLVLFVLALMAILGMRVVSQYRIQIHFTFHPSVRE